MWAGLMALACLMVLLAIEKGALWREREEEEQEGRAGLTKRARGGGDCVFFQILCCACEYPVVCRSAQL